MKWFLLLSTIVICALIVLMGWIYVRDTGTSTEIIIVKEEVKKDTNTAVEAAKELGRDVEQSIDELSDGDSPEAETSPAPGDNGRVDDPDGHGVKP